MRKFYLLAALLLAACAENGGPGPIDPQKFLASLEGPKIPTVQDSLIESAQRAEKQGDFSQAAQFYQQALEKHPNDKDIMLPLADAYRRAGDNDKALGLYDELLKADANNLGAKEGKGLALMAKGDFDTPAALFDQVVKADGTRWKTLNALGILFTTRNMQTEAQKYFDAALKYHADSPSILNNKGLSQALAAKYDDAIATLTRAAGFATPGTPERKRIDLNTALVYAIAGKTDSARAIAENYYSGAELDNNMGLYAHLAHDDQEAHTYLNMALTESKTFYERAWNNLQNIGDTSGSKGNSSPDVNVHKNPNEDKPAPVTPTPKPVKPSPKKAPKFEPVDDDSSASPEDDPIAKIIDSTSKKSSAPDPAPAPASKNIEDIVNGTGK